MRKILYSKPFIIIVLLLLVISGTFYWFAYRPARIRHDCSWVKHITPETPAQPAITKADVEASKRKGFCKEVVTRDDPFAGLFNNGLKCLEQPAIPAQPESIWYTEAPKETYDFCIRENGLWR